MKSRCSQSITAPPDIDAACLESGIRFTVEHQPLSHMWQITVGSAVLTSELAAQRGYVTSNDSRSLQLDVPLFAPGYKYQVRRSSLKWFSEITDRVSCVSERHSEEILRHI